MRLLCVALFIGAAVALPKPDDSNVDIDKLYSLLGEGGGQITAEHASGSGSTSGSTASSTTIIGGGGGRKLEDLIEITVDEVGDHGLECISASEWEEGETVTYDSGVSTSSSAAAGVGGAASSSSGAAGGVSSSSSGAAGATRGASTSSSGAAGGGGASTSSSGAAGGHGVSTSSSGAAGAGGAATSSSGAAGAGGAAASSSGAAGHGGAATSSSGAAGHGGAATSSSGAAGAGGAATSSSGAAGHGGAATSSSGAAGHGGAATSSSGAAGAGGAATSSSGAAGAGGAATSSAGAAGHGGAATSSSGAAGAGGAAASSSGAAGAGGAATSSSGAAGGGGAATSSSGAAAGGAATSTSSAGTDYTLDYEDYNFAEECADEPGFEHCECVPYYQCRFCNIITDGGGLLDMRFGPNKNNKETQKAHSKCENFLDVCCIHPEKNYEKPEPIKEYVPLCGRRNPKGINVELDGFKDSEAQFGEFPWMAAILTEEDLGYGDTINRYVCGGTLIHPQVVMTAAHCVAKKNLVFKVRLGEWDTKHEHEYYEHEDHLVEKVVVHEFFNHQSLFNDVALLFLAEPVKLKQHIDTICLPEKGQNFDYAHCIATGWGKDKFEGGSYQNIMKQIDLQPVDRGSCLESLRKTRLGRYFRLHKSFMCAGGEAGVDTCKGDGGSGLVCPDPHRPGQYAQSGIVAWGIGCGEKGIPGVYADVATLVDWINKKIGKQLGDSGTYPSPQKGY